MTFTAVMNYITLMLCLYIGIVGLGRMFVMGWHSHRRSWQVIYLLMVMAAASNIELVFNENAHAIPLFMLIATAMWFRESRNRWRAGAPDYMKVNAFERKSTHAPL